VALVGSFELLMMLIRTGRGTRTGEAELELQYKPAPPLAQDAPLELPIAPTLEQTVRARHKAGPQPARHSQRTQHRPPQGQTYPRPSGMIQRTDWERSQDTSVHTESCPLSIRAMRGIR
jgi:hypothetical protein